MIGQTLVPCPHCAAEYKKQGIASHIIRCKKNPERVSGVITKSTEEIFCENSTVARHIVKKRILSDYLIAYKCEICNCDPVWQGKPMPLILDHINGKNNDNRLENLRFICSNCDSQLDTYKSKNIGR